MGDPMLQTPLSWRTPQAHLSRARPPVGPGLGGGGGVGNLGLDTPAGRAPSPHCPAPLQAMCPCTASKSGPPPGVSQREGVLRSPQRQREQKEALRDPETGSSARPQQVGLAAGAPSQGTKPGKKVPAPFLCPHPPQQPPLVSPWAADSTQGWFGAER